MNIFLIGMMGSGKSSIGKPLAKIFENKFIDTDIEIEHKYQKKVNQLFLEEGEDSFRNKEKQLLSEIKIHDNLVIATGGGFPCFNDNIDIMNELGITVYLKAAPAFLASRLKSKKQERPLIASLNDEELVNYLDQLLHEREKFYNKAKLHIEAKNLKAQELAELLMKS